MDADRAPLSGTGFRALAYGAPLAFLALFFVFPLAAILERGLGAEGDFASPLDVLTDPVTREVVWFTIWQAIASTALTIAVAVPAAYVLGRFSFRGRALVRALVLVPFVGSGSECVAAIQTGRRFVGAEINARYVEIARSRVDEILPELFQVRPKKVAR